jgi:DNA polymerase-3 subunit delta'
MLLDTIISRCQLIKFNTIPLKLVEKNLIDFFNINEQKSKILSILSAGKIKTALKLNDDKIMKIRNEVLNLFYNHCSQKNFLNHYLLSFKLSRYIEKHELYKQNKQYLPHLVLDLVLTVLRDLLVYKQFYNKNQIINIDYLEKLNNIIKKYSIEEIETFLYNVNESYDLIQKHSRLLLVFINIFLIKKEGAEF